MYVALIVVGYAALVLVIVRLTVELTEHKRIVRKTDAMLTCWAKGWTDTPEVLQAKLLVIIAAFNNEDAAEKVGTQHMGLDLGVSSIVRATARRWR